MAMIQLEVGRKKTAMNNMACCFPCKSFNINLSGPDLTNYILILDPSINVPVYLWAKRWLSFFFKHLTFFP